MSDELTTENIETETTETTEQPQGSAEVDWKAQARKWEARAKDAQADRELAAKWREYESSQKSEHEKLADELARAKAEASEASSKLLRYQVAAQKGIPADALDLLPGSSLEELETAADKLLSLIADQSKPKTPRPDENQGKPANASIGQLTKDDLKGMSPKAIMEAKEAGRLNDVLGIH
jgi:hypothetical protein